MSRSPSVRMCAPTTTSAAGVFGPNLRLSFVTVLPASSKREEGPLAVGFCGQSRVDAECECRVQGHSRLHLRPELRHIELPVVHAESKVTGGQVIMHSPVEFLILPARNLSGLARPEIQRLPPGSDRPDHFRGCPARPGYELAPARARPARRPDGRSARFGH